MPKLSTDFRVGVLNPRENLFRTSSLSSVSADTAIFADGTSTFMFRLSGTFVATVQVEASIDGTNYDVLPMRQLNAASKGYVLSATAAGTFAGVNPGYTQIRVRCTAFTSGSAVFTLTASNTIQDQSLEADIAGLTVPATGTAGAAVTCTLPAVSGLRHYITNIRVERIASALLIAAATPVIVTTTNLPGARAYSFPADAAPIGNLFEKVDNFGYALASSAQNTATTIVCPATTSTIWRVQVDYYLAQ